MVRTVFLRSRVKRTPMKTAIISTPKRTARQDFMDYAEKRLINVNFIIPLLLSLALIYTYSADAVLHGKDPAKSTNYFNQILLDIVRNPNTATLGAWIIKNVPFIFGMIAFIPTILAMPKDKRTSVLVMLTIYFFVMPMRTPYEYSVEATLLYLFMGTTNLTYRMTTIVIGALLYFMQFWTFLPSFTAFNYASAPAPPTHAPTTAP